MLDTAPLPGFDLWIVVFVDYILLSEYIQNLPIRKNKINFVLLDLHDAVDFYHSTLS